MAFERQIPAKPTFSYPLPKDRVSASCRVDDVLRGQPLCPAVDVFVRSR